MTDDLHRAQTLLTLHRYADAERAARTLLSTGPDSADALRILAAALMEQNRDDEALDAAKNAVRLQPEYPQGLVLLADLYRRSGDHVRARETASAAVTAAPHLWTTYYTRAHARLGSPRPDPRGALADIEEAWRLAPHNSSVHNMYGMCLGAMKQRKQARAAYEEALRLDPTNAFALNNLAALDLNGWRVGRASRHLTVGLAHSPQIDVLRKNFDVVLLRFLQRFWWLLLAIGIAEAALVFTGRPWLLRAGLGLVSVAALAWLVRRVMRGLPRGTPELLRGLWKRSPVQARLLMSYWAVTLTGTLLLAFAPPALAHTAGVVMSVLVVLLTPSLVTASFIRYLNR